MRLVMPSEEEVTLSGVGHRRNRQWRSVAGRLSAPKYPSTTATATTALQLAGLQCQRHTPIEPTSAYPADG